MRPYNLPFYVNVFVGDGVLDVPEIFSIDRRTAKGGPYKCYIIAFTRSAVERKQIMLNVQSKRACERIVDCAAARSAAVSFCKGETKGRGRKRKPQQKSAFLPLP